MRILVYEHVTGGGMMGRPLPASLAAEGEQMLRALANDLTEIAGLEVVVLRDRRRSPLDAPVQTVFPLSRREFWPTFNRTAEQCDAVWPIAPETGGVLESLSRGILRAGRRLIGSDPESVRIAASKFLTCRALLMSGVPTLPTYRDWRRLPWGADGIVAKPDDGAGCQNTFLFSDRAALRAQFSGVEPAGFVFQPFVKGKALSLSLLCWNGRARLLSCNRQRVIAVGGRLGFKGVTVGAVKDVSGEYARLASQVAAALPGLWGYIGVDVVHGPEGPVVVEVNPRLTTSYVGLRRAIRANPAALVLSLPDSMFVAGGSTRRSPLTLKACYAG